MKIYRENTDTIKIAPKYGALDVQDLSTFILYM